MNIKKEFNIDTLLDIHQFIDRVIYDNIKTKDKAKILAVSLYSYILKSTRLKRTMFNSENGIFELYQLICDFGSVEFFGYDQNFHLKIGSHSAYTLDDLATLTNGKLKLK